MGKLLNCMGSDITMTDLTYLQYMHHAEQLLLAVEQGCDQINDHSDADVDVQRSGNVVTITFANRSQIVVNLQKPLHEVWLAAHAGGFHYRFDGTQWRDTKGGEEFFSCLSRCATEQAELPAHVQLWSERTASAT